MTSLRFTMSCSRGSADCREYVTQTPSNRRSRDRETAGRTGSLMDQSWLLPNALDIGRNTASRTLGSPTAPGRGRPELSGYFNLCTRTILDDHENRDVAILVARHDSVGRRQELVSSRWNFRVPPRHALARVDVPESHRPVVASRNAERAVAAIYDRSHLTEVSVERPKTETRFDIPHLASRDHSPAIRRDQHSLRFKMPFEATEVNPGLEVPDFDRLAFSSRSDATPIR